MTEHYFKMEINLIEDDRVELLMDETGNEGFGVYMLLLCALRKKEKYRCNVRSLKVLAKKYNMQEELLTKVIQNYGLFGIEKEGEEMFIVSPYLLKVMAKMDEKRAEQSAGGKKRAATAERATNGRFTSSVQLKEKSIKDLLSTTLSSSGEVEEKKAAAEAEKEETKKETKKELEKEFEGKPKQAAEQETVEATEKAEAKAPSYAEAQPEKKTPEGIPITGWERHVTNAISDHEWLCIVSMQSGLPMLQRTAEIAQLFKQHVLMQGTEQNINCLREAKSYMANFLRRGSITHKHVITALNTPQATTGKKDPYRFEERDPSTGERSYYGMPIPDNAPPRPDENAVWGKEGWTR